MREILGLQDELNKKVGLSQEEALLLSKEDRLTWIRKYCQACYVELGEILVEADFKWWKKKELNEDNLKEEVIDLLHFTLSLALITGMDHDEIKKRYFEKNGYNFKRDDWDKNPNEGKGDVECPII